MSMDSDSVPKIRKPNTIADQDDFKQPNPLGRAFALTPEKPPLKEQDIYEDLMAGTNYSPLTAETSKCIESALLSISTTLAACVGKKAKKSSGDNAGNIEYRSL